MEQISGNIQPLQDEEELQLTDSKDYTEYRDEKRPSKVVRFADIDPEHEKVRRNRGGSPQNSSRLLYGTLEVEILQARSLPNMDWFSRRLIDCISFMEVCSTICARAEEKAERHKITSDPYVAFTLGDATLAKTRVISNSQDPLWNEKFRLHVAHSVSNVVFTVKDSDVFGAQVIGTVKVSAERLLSGPPIIQTWFDVLGANGKPVKQDAQLKVSLKFIPVEKDLSYEQGVGESSVVPRTYFTMRKGCDVKLYQDAHCRDGQVESVVQLENGKKYEAGRCWEDIFQAILDARHLVYIAGWSVNHNVKLLRGGAENNPRFTDDVLNLTLGDLLKRKAAEGVRVLMLVWNDKTSHQTRFFSRDGIMGTYDEHTNRFFKHSSVRCVLASRYGDSKLSWLKQRVVGTFYSHHQKLMIVDTEGTRSRKLTAFLGGLDLAVGRYDTPEHPVCSTLNTVHKDDYYNLTFPGTGEMGGPRQPWHDLHCRIEGHAAYDVLTNFEQRWRKSARWHTDALIEIHRIPWVLSPDQGDEALTVKENGDPERWHVQVLRSIDSGSVRGFPKEPEDAEKQNLVSGKNVAIDMSIHTAYVERIRSAQHFIYIESQYFLGSSYAWPDYQSSEATHMIPMELALKIASKIRSQERFAAYVVVPMAPEGVPDSATIQEILYFQSQTIKMMHKIIASALQEVGSQNHPTDYLNFYCLGNRESQCGTPAPVPGPAEKSAQWYAQKNKRFMIYVHSKAMIVDDEYIIVGSANINQRSMDGARDTELAMGAYQPNHTWAHKRGRQPLGQIYGYRASLWSEHLGFFDSAIFNEPWELKCVRKVNELAKGNWEQFVSEKPSDMKGHLMTYPIKVEGSGDIGPVPGYETFPDVGGQILGKQSVNLPDNLTG